MKRLWIVTELFYPDETSTSYVLSKVADVLTEKYMVNVITTANAYQKNQQLINRPSNINKNIRIRRLKNVNLDKNFLIKRVVRLITLTIQFSIYLFFKIKNGEKVLIVTNPAPLMIALSFFKKIRNFELIILVHDVFPENTIPSGIIKNENSFIYKKLLKIFNWSYLNSNTLIVLGRDMKKVFENKFKNIKNAPTIKIIENWSDTVNIENIDFRENPEICQNKILIQYAGNIGRTQGLIEFINVISKVKIKNFVFHLWGDGALLNELKKHVEDLKLNDVVKFFGSYTRAEQNKVLNLTDISLVTLSDGMYGLGVPSKAYNILSTGKPILYIGHMQSEIALMVKEHEIGFCFDSNNLQKLVEFLTNLSIDDIEKLKKMGDKARYISEFNYNESKILLKYLEII